MTAATDESKKERKKPKWSQVTKHKRRQRAFLRDPTGRIVLKRSRVRSFAKQQTLELLQAKVSQGYTKYFNVLCRPFHSTSYKQGEDRNKDIYPQDIGKVTRFGERATNLMAQIMEKYISTTMGKLRVQAEHAGRKTVKIRDLKMLGVQ